MHHDFAKRLREQPPCAAAHCPFRAIQAEILLVDKDPAVVIREAIQYTEKSARTMVRVEARALHKLLDRLVAAESFLTRTGKV